MDFSGVDFSDFKTRKVLEGGRYRIETRLKYELQLDYRSAHGVLEFTCISNGKKIGHTTIEFQD